RSDGGPDAVDHHRLGVHHGRLVFEDADAAAEELFVVPAAGLADDGNVDVLAGDDDADVDAAPHRAFQGADGVAVGDEVRVGDVDRLHRADDGDDVHQLHRRASLGRRGLDDLRQVATARAEGRKVVEAGQQLAAALDPVVH